MTGKYLITTDGWFYAPDGQQYKAVWGDVKIVEDNVIGVKTNRNSTNWFAQVGSDDMEVIIAGCQIHYAVRCENVPSLELYNHEEFHEGKVVVSQMMSRIYLAQKI